MPLRPEPSDGGDQLKLPAGAIVLTAYASSSLTGCILAEQDAARDALNSELNLGNTSLLRRKRVEDRIHLGSECRQPVWRVEDGELLSFSHVSARALRASAASFSVMSPSFTAT